MKNSIITSNEYSVYPSLIKFDLNMVGFNRLQNKIEYDATLESIKDIGQTTPIHINDVTNLCENGRHRVKACIELGIMVKCITVDGKSPISKRLSLYNTDIMSGKDLSPSQKAVQAHKYSVQTGTKLDLSAVKFKTNARAINAVNTISGLGRNDVIKEIEETGYWIGPNGVKMKDVRRIASELKSSAEVLEDTTAEEHDIDYTSMINTETGKKEFWKMRTVVQLSSHELNMLIVKYMNLEYRLKVNNVTGEVTELLS